MSFPAPGSSRNRLRLGGVVDRESSLFKKSIDTIAFPAMNRHMRTYYVYILASNRNGTLYVGVTNTLPRRVEEHKRMINKGFTARYKVRKLVWFQGFHRVQDAIATEKKIKRWNRAWKLQLIDSFNHEWRDLSEPVE